CDDPCAAGRGNVVNGAAQHPSGSRRGSRVRTSPHGLHAPPCLPSGRGLRLEKSLQALVVRPKPYGGLRADFVLRVRAPVSPCLAAALARRGAAARVVMMLLLVPGDAHWKSGLADNI